MKIEEILSKVDHTLLNQGATWEEITMNLYHNRRWIFRLHDKALTVVQEILDRHETSHQKPL